MDNEVVDVEQLSSTIVNTLENYSEEVTEEIKKDIDIVSEECNKEIKNHITFNQPTGKYVKSFKIKKAKEGKYNKVNVWYVQGPYYRLTHLLENGHAKRNGGRVKAYPHICYGEALAKRRMEELTKEAIENAGY